MNAENDLRCRIKINIYDQESFTPGNCIWVKLDHRKQWLMHEAEDSLEKEILNQQTMQKYIRLLMSMFMQEPE